MRRVLSQCLLVVIVIVFCCSCPPWTGLKRETLRIDGRNRTYRVHVPLGYDGAAPVPVVIMLHGFLETGTTAARVTGFGELGDREGFLSVFPDGVNRSWRYQRTPESTGEVDDVAFLEALVERLGADYAVDPRRVYVAGFSNGGFMAQRLACDCADRFAAVASVCASLPTGLSESCEPCAPFPVVIIGGTADSIVPWEGGTVEMGPGRSLGLLSFADTVAYWVERNGCEGNEGFLLLPDLDPDDGTRVEYASYGGGGDGGGVDFWVVNGGGHAWPGGRAWYPERIVGRTSRDIDATELIWRFFERHVGTVEE